MSFPTKYLLISELDVRHSQMVSQPCGKPWRPFGKQSSGWLEAGQWVCVLGPSMKVVTFPLQWDSVDGRAFEKEVVYITKNNSKYGICRFG